MCVCVCVCVFQCIPNCTIIRMGFRTRRIDGFECGLFSIHAPLGMITLRVGRVWGDDDRKGEVEIQCRLIACSSRKSSRGPPGLTPNRTDEWLSTVLYAFSTYKLLLKFILIDYMMKHYNTCLKILFIYIYIYIYIYKMCFIIKTFVFSWWRLVSASYCHLQAILSCRLS